MARDGKVYGVADLAWQVVVGCDPQMPCAKKCWARKTVARIVECQTMQHPERAEFFQIALTPDLKQWSGEVRLDEAHLTDPLTWRKPGLVATGFHGDIGRLKADDLDRIFGVLGLSQMFETVYPSRYLLLTKQPHALLEYLDRTQDELAQQWGCGAGCLLDGDWIWREGKRHRDRIEAFVSAGHGFYPDDENMLEEDAFPVPLKNTSIGCSVMYQSGEFGADQMREPMRAIAELGWATHVWYEPALGPVNWQGWEFLRGVISGGESGENSRPSQAVWHQSTRDWCVANCVPYNLKQWGDWLPDSQNYDMPGSARSKARLTDAIRVGKKIAGRLLDGRVWDGVPEFGGTQ